jgi:hypothetical protein
MKKSLMLVLISLFFAITPAQGQHDLAVVLKTDPAATQIGPDESFTRTTLTVVDSEGQPAPNSYLKLHLDAPPGNSLISTDFPMVEDRPLLSYEGIVPAGTLEFEYIYPIRGVYSFEVEAGRDPSTLTVKDRLALSLSENRPEVINFIILLALLFGLGLVAGFIIGRGARAQRLATAGVVSVLGVAFVGGSISIVRAHGGGAVSHAEPFSVSHTQESMTLTYAMAPGAGRVGSLNRLTFSATDAGGNLIPETTFEVVFWHVEDDKPVFATSLYAPTGEADLEFQFFDGADHEVRLTANNALGRAALDKVVEVEGLNPPLPTKIKTTFYLVLVTFVGILIGLRLQGVQGRKQQLASLGA